MRQGLRAAIRDLIEDLRILKGALGEDIEAAEREVKYPEPRCEPPVG
jgi:hypothetical protein